MVSIQEVLDSARKYQFEYAIVITDSTGDVKSAIGLNGLTKKIVDTINAYMELINNFRIQYDITVYEVRSGKQITILDIPMYFAFNDDSPQNPGIKPSGFMWWLWH